MKKEKTYWTTFYSYKGGVGRSMALVNIATQLAKMGRSVMMIDFDLEAPGLDSFSDLGVSESEGVVEYISSYLASGEPDQIEKYIQKCGIADDFRGDLWLMPSGKRGEKYNHLRAAIDWENIYEHRAGALFVENWKAEIEEKYDPDYVFIDSRTGLTEIGGVCTLHFPDLVVLLFALNDQNIEGSGRVFRLIKEQKNQDTLLVATPVPNLSMTDSVLKSRFEKVFDEFGEDVDNRIRYYYPAALEEKLFCLEESDSICDDYNGLIKSIFEKNRSGLDHLINQLQGACKSMDEVLAEDLCHRLKTRFPSNSEAQFACAKKALVFGDSLNYEKIVQDIVRRDPSFDFAVSSYLSICRTRHKHKDLIETLRPLVEKNEVGFSESLRDDAFSAYGEACMAEHLYKDAHAIYSRLCEFAEEPEEEMRWNFNKAESKRRMKNKAIPSDWNPVINFYEHIYDEEKRDSEESDVLANVYQAMHIAYACVGNIDQAKLLLKTAVGLMYGGTSDERIFLVSEYRLGSDSEFLADNKKMLKGLDAGELWDGMKLKK